MRTVEQWTRLFRREWTKRAASPRPPLPQGAYTATQSELHGGAQVGYALMGKGKRATRGCWSRLEVEGGGGRAGEREGLPWAGRGEAAAALWEVSREMLREGKGREEDQWKAA